MPQPKKIKICLVGDALSGGGAERVHAFLSEYFTEQGIEVHNAIVQDRVTYHFSGELLNLGQLKDKSNGFTNKLKRFRVLRSYIKKHQFDYVIDFRMRRKYVQDWFIAKLIYRVPTVYTVHHYIIQWYMPQKAWFTRAIYADAYGVISITQKMKKLIEDVHGLTNVTNIYNPVSIKYVQNRMKEPLNGLDFDYIIAAGKLGGDNIKQFDKLIEAYANSRLPANNIKLVILGEGAPKDKLIKLSEEINVGNKVIFKGFQENPYVYMRNALFYAMTSRNEGLPMVLLESLACGTPVIAFDCFSGPSEIIIDKVNGLLIEDQNMQKFTEGLNLLFEDTILYANCKQNALGSIQKFSLDTIGKEWMEFLKIEQKL